MNFGQGIYTWLMTNIQPLVLGGIIIVGLVLLFKHKIAELIVFAIIAVKMCIRDRLVTGWGMCGKMVGKTVFLFHDFSMHYPRGYQ